MKKKLTPGDVKDYYVAKFDSGSPIRLMRRVAGKKILGAVQVFNHQVQTSEGGWKPCSRGFVKVSAYFPNRRLARIAKRALKAKVKR